MPEEQRQRRLAWGETLERMSPDERMRVNLSARRLAAMPPDRQALVKRAFQDLRSVLSTSARPCLIRLVTRVLFHPRNAACFPISCASSLTSRLTEHTTRLGNQGARRCLLPLFAEGCPNERNRRRQFFSHRKQPKNSYEQNDFSARIGLGRYLLKILLSAYACEPGKGSEPGMGWHWRWRLRASGTKFTS